MVMLARLADMKEERAELAHVEESLERRRKDSEDAAKAYRAAAARLSEKRRAAAPRFAAAVQKELRGLAPVLPKPLAIDLYFAATALPPRYARKLDPVDKVGDFRADGVLIGVGLDLRTRF